ncbi:MAG: hypothetical protein HY673_21995 [Chloroflexi bacterium]|nr:hypothetical protein [Chloroflexota bacterium]
MSPISPGTMGRALLAALAIIIAAGIPASSGPLLPEPLPGSYGIPAAASVSNLETMSTQAVLFNSLYAGREKDLASLSDQDRAFLAAASIHANSFAPSSEPALVDLLGRSGGTLSSMATAAYSGRSWGYSARAPALISAGHESLDSLYTSPLILDLKGDGSLPVAGGIAPPHPGLFDRSRHTLFDIDGDGYPDLTEWVGPEVGILVLPVSGRIVESGGVLTWSGPISALDLIGNAGGYRSGFEHLSILDANGDGAVNGQELIPLFVWRDDNENGRPEAGEILRPADLQIESLSLEHRGHEGSYVRGGQSLKMWDWWPTFLLAKPSSPPGDLPASAATAEKKLAIRQLLTGTGGPDLTADIETARQGEADFIPRQKLQSLGFNWSESSLALLSPDAGKIVLMDFHPAPPHITRLWVLEKTGNKKFRVLRFPLAGHPATNAVFSADSREILVTTNNGTFFYLIRTGPSPTRHILQFNESDLNFRMVYGAAVSHEGRFYLPGYFNDGRRTYDSLARLTVSDNRFSLEPFADVNWLLGKRLTEPGMDSPYAVSIQAPDLSYALAKNADGKHLVLAITGRDPQRGKVIVIGSYSKVLAVSANGRAIEYVVAAETGHRIFLARVADDRVARLETINFGGPANYAELAAGGRTPAWGEFDWVNGIFRYWYAGPRLEPRLILETRATPGAFRVSSRQDGWSLQTHDGLYAGRFGR